MFGSINWISRKSTGKASLLIFYIFILFSSLLTACGGGGGDATPTTPPSSPVGITVSAEDSANTLQWNSVNGATAYHLYWSTAAGAGLSGTTILDISSPFAHTGLTNDTTYYYVITADNSAGESEPSVEASGTPVVPPPDAPSLQGVTPGDRTNLLSWNAVTGATSYNIYWSTSSGGAVSASQILNVTSPYQHTGLTNGTTYYYAVTSVNGDGESNASAEISGTPFIPPYATQQYPFHLGSAPLSEHAEVIPDDIREFYYTLSVNAGSTYMFNLSNITDYASLEVFTDDTWGYSFGAECSSYGGKSTLRCSAIARSNGTFYIRIGSGNTHSAENVSLKVDKLVNQGEIGTPVDLGSAPIGPVFATVLESGQSLYQVAVTAGKSYRVMLTDWRDSGATLSKLFLSVYDGEYTGINGADLSLCNDYGGNSGVDHEHRLRTIHCLAKPASSGFINIVTGESQYGDGARYDIVVEEALTEGTALSPVNITADAFVYHGEITADDGNGASYYKLSVTPNTYYLVDLRGMHLELGFVVMDNTFTTTTNCSSYEFNLIDESCMVNSAAEGLIYLKVKNSATTAITDTFILSAIPSPVNAVAPARYPDEGIVNLPVALSLPVQNRLSTVGAGTSYYSIPVTAGSSYQIMATEMNVDVDLLVFSDADHLTRLCISQKAYTQDDSCTITVPDGINTLYVKISGLNTTNNGSWSSGTQEDVGAMFRLTAEAI